MSVLIIAEAGVNHNGSLEIAKKLVLAAKDAGANCIKFQTFKSSKIVSKNADKADYQKQQTDKDESQYEMLKKLELSYDEFIELASFCDEENIEFLSTAFDFESVEFLASLDMKRWKIPSGEITNLPYLIKIAELGKPVILSTGMSHLEEVGAAVKVLREHGAGPLTVLHCTTEYPAPYEEVNLNAMQTMSKAFDVEIGYSDHTKGIEISLAAVALGAKVVEKHFTLDTTMDGPDHQASIEPVDLTKMISSIRNIELSLGHGRKEVTASEKKNIAIVRKSIVAKSKIKKGQLFTDKNITTKRPGNGLSPMKWFDVIGQVSTKDYEEDELIKL